MSSFAVTKEQRLVPSFKSPRVNMLWVQLLVISSTLLAVQGRDPLEVFAVIYEWNQLDFLWPDDSSKARFLDTSQFIPENTTISGVKVWGDRFYVTLPRWRRGVPATLASIPVPKPGNYRNASPKLEPFPSWEMQQVGNCSALQNVQNVEIDPTNGYMWVIDSGRTDTLSQRPDNRCPPKIVVFDLISAASSPSYNTFYETGYRQGSTERSQTSYQQGGYNPAGDNQGRYDSQGVNYYGYNPTGANNDRYNPQTDNYNGYNPQSGSRDGYNPPSGSRDGYNPQSGSRDGYNPPSGSRDGYNPPSGTRDGYNTPSGSRDGYNPQNGNYDRYNNPRGNQGGYNNPDDYQGYGSPRNYNTNNKPAFIVRVFTFPDTVTSQDTELEDIVLDTDGFGYTYISDASETDPGLIVYSWKENRPWKVRDSRSMRADPGVRTLSFNGVYVDINSNIAGLALSPVSYSGERRLYYSPLSSYSLFSIPTSVLKDETRAIGDVSAYVKTHGRKTSISEGMAMDSRGVLYYGLLGENAIAKWDTNLPFEGNQQKIAQDTSLLQWPASFGFDSQLMNLTVVSNRLQNFLAGRVHLNEPNCRIISAYTGTKSYLYQPTGLGYGTSPYRPTQTGDYNYNDERGFIQNTQRQQVTGSNFKSATGRITPVLFMTAVLLVARLAVA